MAVTSPRTSLFSADTGKRRVAPLRACGNATRVVQRKPKQKGSTDIGHLTAKEAEICKELVDGSGGLLTSEDVLEALVQLGQPLLPSELTQLLQEVGQRDGRALTVEQFQAIMSRLKEEFVQAAQDPDLDTVRAFVAVGGQQDKGGNISVRRLQETIEGFGLEFDFSLLNSSAQRKSRVSQGGQESDDGGDAAVSMTYRNFADIFSSDALGRHANEQRSVERELQRQLEHRAANAAAILGKAMRKRSEQAAGDDASGGGSRTANVLRVLMNRKRQRDQHVQQPTPNEVSWLGLSEVESAPRVHSLESAEQSQAAARRAARTPSEACLHPPPPQKEEDDGAALTASRRSASQTSARVEGGGSVVLQPSHFRTAELQASVLESRRLERQRHEQEEQQRRWLALGRSVLAERLSHFLATTTAGDVVLARSGDPRPSAARQIGLSPPPQTPHLNAAAARPAGLGLLGSESKPKQQSRSGTASPQKRPHSGGMHSASTGCISPSLVASPSAVRGATVEEIARDLDGSDVVHRARQVRRRRRREALRGGVVPRLFPHGKQPAQAIRSELEKLCSPRLLPRDLHRKPKRTPVPPWRRKRAPSTVPDRDSDGSACGWQPAAEDSARRGSTYSRSQDIWVLCSVDRQGSTPVRTAPPSDSEIQPPSQSAVSHSQEEPSVLQLQRVLAELRSVERLRSPYVGRPTSAPLRRRTVLR
eukprot:TRINITY_DN19195_c0_g1_i1.p1 TRINITY_DN19195_c0_g1~~TRINITY_DN19195_c0_g1_i1.p1  ORF type:complete len:746 (+),score=206.69 TRINITY_DN19195_c0_g1_i1:122-2239(+)